MSGGDFPKAPIKFDPDNQCVPRTMKFGRLIASIKFYKMCNFENQILRSDVIMTS